MKVSVRIPRKIPASKGAGYNKLKTYEKVANGCRSSLDAEAYVEGKVTNRTERSDATPSFMKGGSEAVPMRKSGDCRNRFKLCRSRAIYLGS